MIRLETPVVCQNGHRATWCAEYSGYDCRHLGVSDEENCPCPKGERGQGWFVAGPAVAVEKWTGEVDR